MIDPEENPEFLNDFLNYSATILVLTTPTLPSPLHSLEVRVHQHTAQSCSLSVATPT